MKLWDAQQKLFRREREDSLLEFCEHLGITDPQKSELPMRPLMSGASELYNSRIVDLFHLPNRAADSVPTSPEYVFYSSTSHISHYSSISTWNSEDLRPLVTSDHMPTTIFLQLVTSKTVCHLPVHHVCTSRRRQLLLSFSSISTRNPRLFRRPQGYFNFEKNLLLLIS